MVNKYKTGGWYKESQRHSLARKGISTKKCKPIDMASYTVQDLPVIAVDGIGKAGATAVGFIPALVGIGATKKIVKEGKKIAKEIDFYKVSSINDKSNLSGIANQIETRLNARGYRVDVEVKNGSLNLKQIRVSDERIHTKGHNLQQTFDGNTRKTRALSWDDWVEVNDAVNDVLDENSINANVSSLGGKFDIRSKLDGRRTREDWDDLAYENVGSQMNPIQRDDYINRPVDFAKKSVLEIEREKARNKILKEGGVLNAFSTGVEVGSNIESRLYNMTPKELNVQLKLVKNKEDKELIKEVISARRANNASWGNVLTKRFDGGITKKEISQKHFAKKIPDGWARVKWVDAQGRKWSDNMPIEMVGEVNMDIISKGGKVINID